MKPYTIPDPPEHDRTQTPAPTGVQTGQDQPHTESRRNEDRTERNLDAADTAEAMSPQEADRLYDGSQEGEGRSFAKNPSRNDKHDTMPQTVPASRPASAVSESDAQGITNHAAREEAPSQKKVMSERERAVAADKT